MPDLISIAVRFDLTDEFTDVHARQWMAANCESYYMVREGGNVNPHVHGYGVCSKVLASLRQSARRAVGAGGNRAYSLKICDPDVAGYHRYLCKGSNRDTLPQIVCRQGIAFTDEWFKNQHDSYWINNAEVVANRHKRKGITSATFAEKLEERCKEAGITSDKPETIAEECINMHIEVKKPINVHYCKSVCNIVRCLLDPSGHYKKRLALIICPNEILHE